MACPDVLASRAVLNRVWRYLYANRHLGNTFSGIDNGSNHHLTACVDASPLEPVPDAHCILACDATWTGSEERSIKVWALQAFGGTIMHRAQSIHAIMPSSFMAEAEALHDALEAAEYLIDFFIEMGWFIEGDDHVLTLVDNKGLVQTTARRAKGGSKLHRRKLGIILSHIDSGRYTITHVSDKHQRVDFLSKLVGKLKLADSVRVLYNTANAVTHPTPMPTESLQPAPAPAPA